MQAPAAKIDTEATAQAAAQHSASSSLLAKALEDNNLDLSLIGNCSFSALVDKKGCIVWCCIPRFDADPVFCSLLRKQKDIGFFDIDLQGFARSEQAYLKNTPILRTTLHDSAGNSVQITDFAPRFQNFGRSYRPTMIIRMIKPHGRPRIRVRLRPTFGYGWGTPEKTRGSNHIRYLVPTGTLRLTSNAPIAYLLHEVSFELEGPIALILMPDESMTQGIEEFVLSNFNRTKSYWEQWSSQLSLAFEWQKPLIRACITLQLCSYEETGAIIAAGTTSIPSSSSGAGRQDERFCRVQDMPFLIRTLNRMGMINTMENYLRYISNIVVEFCSTPHSSTREALQPLYGIALESLLYQKDVHRLAGYRALGPVVVGNKEFKLFSSDTYGSVILALTQIFFDERLLFTGDKVLFERMEELGRRLLQVYKEPSHDHRLHIYPVVLSWAGCDRLAKIARTLDLDKEVESFWKSSAKEIFQFVVDTFWDEERQFFRCTAVGASGADGGDKLSHVPEVDGQLLLLPEVGFVSFQDPRFLSTLAKVEEQLVDPHSAFLRRVPKDHPSGVSASDTATSIHTIWYIIALHEVGRTEEARSKFKEVLASCNNCGTLSESIDLQSRELWGNFPHTLTTCALLDCACRLSLPWERVL
ncbi:Glycoside hydrolase family 15 protein [Balamuthia mandrillaris]